MGSNQSSPATTPTPQIKTEVGTSASDGDRENPGKKKRRPPPDLTGTTLVEWKCRKKKKAWSNCVGTFYGRFSSGKVLEDEEVDCDALFDQFRECYSHGMLKERQKKGLGAPKEGSVLAEFVEEEGLEPQSQP